MSVARLRSRMLVAFLLLLLVGAGGCRRGATAIESSKLDIAEAAQNIFTVAATKSALYAAGGGNVYRWDGTAWDRLPPLPRIGENDLVRVVAKGDRLLAGNFGFIGSGWVYEWQQTYWKCLGNIRDESQENTPLPLPDGSFVVVTKQAIYDYHVLGAPPRQTQHRRFIRGTRFAAVGDTVYVVADRHYQDMEEVVDGAYLTAYRRGAPLQEIEIDEGVDSVAAAGETLYLLTYPRPAAAAEIRAWSNGTWSSYPAANLQELFGAGPDVYAQSDQSVLWRFTGTHWTEEGRPWALGSEVREVHRLAEALYAVTDAEELWQKTGGAWQKMPPLPEPVLDVAWLNDTFIVNERDVYSLRHGRLRVFAGRRGHEQRAFCTSVVATADSLFAVCFDGDSVLMKAPRRNPVRWTQIALPAQPTLFRRDDEAPIREDLVIDEVDSVLYVAVGLTVYRLSGNVFQPLGFLGQTTRVIGSVNGTLLAGTDGGLFRFDPKTNEWELVDTRLAGTRITSLSRGEQRIFAGTSTGQVWRVNGRNTREAGNTRGGAVRALWSRSSNFQAPDVLLAGTDRGLLWSNDAGSTWTQALDGQAVTAIAKAGKVLNVATTDGVYTVAENIPPQFVPAARAMAAAAARESWMLLAVGVLAALIFPNRLTLRLVGTLPAGAQNAYFLFLSFLRVARSRILKPYRNALKSMPLVSFPGGRKKIDDALKTYVDLPCEGPIKGESVSVEMTALLDEQRVVWIEGKAGLGKTLLLWKIVDELLRRKSVPIVIEGHALAGNPRPQLLQAIRRGGAPITDKIFDEILAAENVVILLDGFSEVRAQHRAVVLEAFAELLSTSQNLRIVISSRLPALKDVGGLSPTAIRLLPVTKESLRRFLSAYLIKRKGELDYLTEALTASLANESEWTPLMLVMMTNNYERKGEIPTSRSQIYGDYFDYLVRPEAIAGISAAGLKFALERVTHLTFLKNRGERGYARSEIIEHLASLREELKNQFALELSAADILEIIVSAGIMVEVARYLRHFHDSFESYVAARYLDDRFQRRQYDEISTYLGSMKGNVALSEVWMFLQDIVSQSGERELAQLVLVLEKKPRRLVPLPA